MVVSSSGIPKTECLECMCVYVCVCVCVLPGEVGTLAISKLIAGIFQPESSVKYTSEYFSKSFSFFFFSPSHLEPMNLIVTILPVVTKDLPISPRFTPYYLVSRCKFSTLTTRQPMVQFYLLTFPRFLLRKKEHKSYFVGRNRTHDFRTSRCAGYLLDHSGDG